MHADSAASCTDLKKTYWTESGTVVALRGVTLDFPQGMVSAIMGPSGSGKSTLLAVLAGFSKATGGSARIGNKELTTLGRRGLRAVRRSSVGYVFQRPSDNFVSYLTLGEHFAMARRRSGISAVEGTDILDLLGLDRRAGHLPHELSGGEQQRAAFAQAMLARPALLVCDEPTAELDTTSAAMLIESMSTLVQLGATPIVATHDDAVAKKADRTILIEDGQIVGIDESESMWMRPS